VEEVAGHSCRDEVKYVCHAGSVYDIINQSRNQSIKPMRADHDYHELRK
jgi:hypothetical protein